MLRELGLNGCASDIGRPGVAAVLSRKQVNGESAVASASYLRGQARLLLQWAGDTKDSVQGARLRKRARELFILAEASDDTNKHLTFALGEFNAQQMGLSQTPQPVQQQQQQQQQHQQELTKPKSEE